jgi:hypothetical protein
MDWIEQLLHVSPDGGSGALGYVAVAALGVAGVARCRLLGRRRRPSGSSNIG